MTATKQQVGHGELMGTTALTRDNVLHADPRGGTRVHVSASGPGICERDGSECRERQRRRSCALECQLRLDPALHFEELCPGEMTPGRSTQCYPRVQPLPDARARVRQWLRIGLWSQSAVSPSELSEYDDFVRSHTRRRVSRITLFLTAFNVFFWATDEWVFRRLPGVADRLAQGRIALVGVALFVLVVLRIRRVPVQLVATAAAVGTCLVVSLTLGGLGGMNTPWFHFLHSFSLLSSFTTYKPWQRLASTVVLASVCLGGFVGPHPHYLSDPFAETSLAYFGYTTILGFVLGSYTDAQRLRSFLAQNALRRERETLAARVDNATESLRQLVQELDRVIDSERARFARDLHDELGQAVVAARIVLKIARDRFAQDASSIGPNLDQLAVLVEDISLQTRRIVADIRPQALDEGDLKLALEWLTSRVSERGIACTLHQHGALQRLPEPLANAAFRCTQEALTNTLKHSGASQATVEVQVDEAGIQVLVSDNGRGLEGAGRSRDTFGLVGMAERARALSGNAEAEALEPNGTRVRIWLPFPGEVVG